MVRTLPTLPYDELRPEDVDTDAEDHAYDALRYGLMAENHRFAGVPKPPETHLEFVHLEQAVRQFVNGIKTMRPYAGASGTGASGRSSTGLPATTSRRRGWP